MTFDAWEGGVYCPDDVLMHWGIPGMKHGRRRYQNEDGTWTEQGLAERRKREGFGERRRARKAAKYQAEYERAKEKNRKAASESGLKRKWDEIESGVAMSKAVYKRNKALGLVSKEDDRFIRKQKKIDDRELRKEKKEDFKEERREKKAERQAARAKAREEFFEKRKRKDISNLTDDELKAKINRLKMEQEYKELKKSPALKLGIDIFNKVLDYKENKRQQEIERTKQMIELGRVDATKIQAIKSAEKAKYDAQAAKSEYKKKKKDVKGGLSIERHKDLLNAKTAYRNTTIWGSIGKRANNRAKYVQEERMNPIEAKKAQRTRALQQLQNAKEEQKTSQEFWKSEQERHKAKGRKP